jgi:hypothetical protein
MLKKPPEVLLEAIERKLNRAAKEAFDYETAEDSDGYDQSVREGIELALDIVQNEFRKAGIKL